MTILKVFKKTYQSRYQAFKEDPKETLQIKIV